MGEKLGALLNGEKRGYAPSDNLVRLYTDTNDGRDPDNFDEAVVKMRGAAEELIERIEQTAQMPIERFTIGKSFARKMENRNFDPSNFKTWLKKGLKDRWDKTYKIDGYNGLVALVGITRELLPPDMKKGRNRHLLHDQQQYAIALEQQLIHYFLFVAKDRRLGNKSLETGALAQNPYAGVVYLAFKLYTILDVWQLFQDSFEMETEPYDTVFIITADNSSIKLPGADGKKKIIGGRKAEEHAITFLEAAELKGVKLKLFVNQIPSEQFARDLLTTRPANETSIIIARNTENSNETLEILSNNGYFARDFGEDDWIQLGTTLYHPEDGITLQKIAENEDLQTYLDIPIDTVMEIFEDSMHEEENKQWIASESVDQVFIISYLQAIKIVSGRIVENRVIRFLNDMKGRLGLNIKIYINYQPNKTFIKLLANTIKEDRKLELASALIGSNDKISEQPIKTDTLTVEMRTITSLDWDELEKL